MDPALVAVAGALSTVAAILYREMKSRIDSAERAEKFWRDRALIGTGLAEIAEAETKRRKAP